MKPLIPFFKILLVSIPLNMLSSPAYAYTPSKADVELLTKIEKDTVQYFIRMSDKVTGLTRDSSRTGSPASIAATGFSLAAVAIGAERGWVPEDYAYEQIHRTLKTLLTKAQHHKGFFFHFLDPRSGRRVWASEASSIDTALLVAGALLAGQFYKGTEIERMAQDVYERIDWQWMMNDSELICMGWKPESGFLPYYWDMYSEHLVLQALAIGSPTHPVPKEAWENWFRNEDTYQNKSIVYSFSGSLFTYQFSHAFIDFRQINDRGIDYFENSVLASLANRDYSLAAREKHKTYSEASWGLTAAIGPGGYKAYGAKPGQGLHDGTIAPYGALSSIIFTPEESIRAAHYFYEQADHLYGHFGFKDSFNLDKKWWAQEYLGIDQGITVLMLENYLKDGLLWEKFMATKPIERWIRKCNLRYETKEFIPAA